MKVNAEIDIDEIKRAIEKAVIKEMRKTIEEYTEEYTLEFADKLFKSKQFREDVFEKKFAQTMEDNVWTLHRVLERAVENEEYRTMTDDEIKCFKAGAIMAHTFDAEDLIDEDVLIDRVTNIVADRIFNWVKEKPTLKNELAKAIREQKHEE